MNWLIINLKQPNKVKPSTYIKKDEPKRETPNQILCKAIYDANFKSENSACDQYKTINWIHA